MLLLTRLLTLGDTLRELRQKQTQTNGSDDSSIRRHDSEGRLNEGTEKAENDDSEDGDECLPLRPTGATKKRRNPIPAEFSRSTPGIGMGVTRLYVRDKEEEKYIGEDCEYDGEEDEIRPNVQYFSRKNSV